MGRVTKIEGTKIEVRLYFFENLFKFEVAPGAILVLIFGDFVKSSQSSGSSGLSKSC